MKPARGRWVLALGACGWLLGGGSLLGAHSAMAAPITGQVYDAASGRPARGISLSLVYDAEDLVSPGGPVAPEDLGAGQQGQVTGYDGVYRFDVPGGRRYRLVLDPAGTPFVAPSARTPARAGFAPLGEVVPAPAPAPPEDPVADRAYYLRFDVPGAGDQVRNNHVAVDRVSTGVTLDKRVDRPEAAPGDVVRYTVRVGNGTARDLGPGQPVYIVDAPAHGLAVAREQAVARVQDGAGTRLLRAGVDFAAVLESPGSGRLVRFGPFELAAGAVLVLDYPATVGLDARPGALDNRAILVDAGGVALSPEGRARLRVTADPVLDMGVILGRVFCDADGDGRRDAGEAGVMGARVYMDTGAYAVTDVEGGYHLSRVRAGSRLVKIDAATLAGGSVLGTPERLLSLSRGLSARVDFAVRCSLVTVGLEAAAAPAREPDGEPAGQADDGSGAAAGEDGEAADAPDAVEVRGDVAAMQVTVAGQAVELPVAELALEVPAALQAGAARNLAPAPAGGYDTDAPRPIWRLGWRGPAGIQAREWRLVVGTLGEGGALAPVRSFRGTGAPPEEVAWDGLDDQGAPVAAGALYAGRLVVEGSARRAEAASARVVLGVGLGATADVAEDVWRGVLFGGSDREPTATAALRTLVAGLAGRLGPADRVEILVHADGSGDRLSALVATQKQAELVAGLLGLAAERISARGRGSLEPVQTGTSEADREANRRVVVKIIPAAVPAVPETAPGPAAARVNRAAVRVAGDGFSARVRPSPRGTVRVDMRAPDGRQATIEVPIARNEVAGTSPEVPTEEVAGTSPEEVPGEVAGTSPEVPTEEVAGTPAGTQAGMVEVQGDLASGAVVAGGRSLPPGLLAVDARLQGDGIELAQDGQALAAPLSFELAVPADLDVRSWLIEITAGDASVYRSAGVGAPPATHAWNGAGPDGSLALTPGTRYAYQLTITTADGARGFSPARHFAGSPAPRLDLRGNLFTVAGKLTPDTRARLASSIELADRTVPHRVELTVANRGGSAVEARLSVAVRKVALEKALASLGLAPEHYELHAGLGTAAEDALTIAGAAAPDAPDAPQSARVLVNGTVQEVAGTAWRAQVRAGEPVTLDITTPDGHRAVVALAPAAPAVARSTAAEKAEAASPGPDAAALAAATRVHLPPAGTVLRARTLAITGHTRPGARIVVATGQDTELPVGADGRFAGVVPLPAGRSDVVIRAEAADGGQARLSWPVTVDDQHLFIMALGETAASTAYVHREDGGRTRTRGLTADTAHIDGLDQASSVRVGPLRLHGRLALFARGRIPASALAPEVDITAHLDTTRAAGSGAFFEQLDDPRTAAPVHGDDAREGRAANTRGPLYLRLDTDGASATVGSMHTDLGRGDLFRYDRTLDGALIQAERAGDGYRIEVRGFRAGLGDLRQDINWYRATGGSLYYLRHGHVIEGSERVRAIVRDALGGLVVSERLLVRDRDYRIDYTSGRVMLAQPLASARSSRWVVDSLEAGAAPLTGNPVFLEVRYEHADPTGADGTDGRAAGVYARGTVGPVAVGAGLVDEGRAGGDYALLGADAAVRVGARSRMTFEVAGARRREADGFLSVDGGLRFTDMSAGALDVRRGSTHLAWKLTQDWHGDDVLDRPWAERTRVQLVAQDVARGFSAGSAALEQGRLELGALLTHRLSDRDTLLLRHDSRMARLPRVGPTEADLAANPDPLILDDLTSHRTAAQWSRVQGRWHHRLEAVHQQVRSDGLLASGAAALDSRRLGLGAATALAYDRRLTLRAGQQVLLDLGDADPRLDPIDPALDPLAADRRTSTPLAGVITNLGADWALTDDLAAGADWYQRWNGDSAGQVGLRSALSDTGSMYLRQRVAARDGSPVATTVLGAEDRIAGTSAGRTYGEYQVENSNVMGRRDRAVLGVGHGWQVAPGARLTLGYEHQHVLGGALPDGTPLGGNQREVVHGGGVYVRPERFEAALRLEMRLDHSTSGPVAVADQRDLTLPGSLPADTPGNTADHGGVVPGAPAALPAGDRVQMLAGGSAAWHLAPAHSMIGRAFLAHTTAGLEASSYTEAQNLELTAGWAYRPPVDDWLHVLARYSHLRDLRPRAEPGAAWREHAHVLAILPLAELPHRLSLSGKLAWKRTSAALEPDQPGEAGAPAAGSALATTAVLWLARLGYRLYGRWDAGVEVRGLHLGKPGQAREARVGALLELGYQIHRHIRLGIGYNMSRFSDDELGDLERDSHGAFIRATGHY